MTFLLCINIQFKNNFQKLLQTFRKQICLKFFTNRLQICIDSSPFLHLLYLHSLVLQSEPFICELAMHKDAESVSGSSACTWLLIPLGAPHFTCYPLPVTRLPFTCQLQCCRLVAHMQMLLLLHLHHVASSTCY